jgi:hypothetical protein
VSLDADVATGGLELGAADGQQVLDVGGHTLDLVKPLEILGGGEMKLDGGTVDLHRAWLRSGGGIEVTGIESRIVGDFNNDGILRVIGASPSDEPTLAMSRVLCTNEVIIEAVDGQNTRLEFETLILAEGSLLHCAAATGGNYGMQGDLAAYGDIVIDNTLLIGGVGRDSFRNFGYASCRGALVIAYTSDTPMSNFGEIDIESGGGLTVLGTGRVANFGTLDVGADTIADFGPSYVQRAGQTRVRHDSTLMAPEIDIQRGWLRGSGTVSGQVLNSGVFKPGQPAHGSLTIQGDYTQLGDAPGRTPGQFRVEIEGLTQGTFASQLILMPDPARGVGTGTAQLDGELRVILQGGYAPLDGATYDILVASSVTGTFSDVQFENLPPGITAEVIYAADRVVLRFTGGDEPPTGDIDFDGDVDIRDYAGFADCLAGPGETPDPTGPGLTTQRCLDACDFDEDNDVDSADFQGFQAAFGTTGG